MTLDEIKPLEVQPDPNLVAQQKTAKEQLSIKDHPVNNTTLRPEKTTVIDTDKIDEETGEPITKTITEDVNRIAIPFQKLIVKRRLAFMNVKNVKLLSDPKTDNEQRLFDFVNKIREDNKIRYKEVQVAKYLLEDLQSAKLYYFDETDKNNYPLQNKGASKLRMRMKVLAPSLGDTLIPILDDFGSMVMFIRRYNVQDDAITEVFTAEFINVYINDILDTERSGANAFGKIPITYYSLKETIWGDVQPMIQRVETLLSNFADTVDYNGAPILKSTGEIKGFSKRGERGKVFELSDGADLDYVSWDSAPEAIRLELEKLTELIFSCSQTPNISFEQMKGLGGITGVGMDRVFLDAQLAANDIIDSGYGESTQRDINIQIAGAIFIDNSLQDESEFEIWFDLEAYRFDDVNASIDILVKAFSGGLLSRKTAVMSNPLVEGNGQAEYDQILEEEGSLSMKGAEEEADV